MKKILVLPALFLASGAAFGQSNALKIDIFQPIINTAALSFEHKLSETSSFQLGVSGTFKYKEDNGLSSGFGGTYMGPVTSGFAITPEYRLYLSEKHPALEGFYVAPFLRFQYLKQTGIDYNSFYQPIGGGYPKSYEASLTAFGLGVTVGRHWIFKQRFSLDIFTGPGYTFADVSSDQPAHSPRKGDFIGYYNENNYDFRGGATFGVAF